jgi:hypothetical protein
VPRRNGTQVSAHLADNRPLQVPCDHEVDRRGTLVCTLHHKTNPEHLRRWRDNPRLKGLSALHRESLCLCIKGKVIEPIKRVEESSLCRSSTQRIRSAAQTRILCVKGTPRLTSMRLLSSKSSPAGVTVDISVITAPIDVWKAHWLRNHPALGLWVGRLP